MIQHWPKLQLARHELLLIVLRSLQPVDDLNRNQMNARWLETECTLHLQYIVIDIEFIVSVYYYIP